MGELNTQGIWTEHAKQDIKFVRFHNIILDYAKKRNCVFFGWSDEGNELVTDELNGSNRSGLLIPFEDVEEFEKQWLKNPNDIDERFWEECFCVAEWFKEPDGSIGINFRFR